MSRHLRVRTNPAISVVASVIGIGFILLGLFVAIPRGGIFGIVWTLVATGITAAHLYNVFGKRGFAHEIVEVSDGERSEEMGREPAERLRTLEDLRAKSLITPAEYEQRRSEILRSI